MNNENLVLTSLTLRNLKPNYNRFKNDKDYRQHIINVIVNWQSYWTSAEWISNNNKRKMQ